MTHATAGTTVRDIVTADYRAAAVFERHGIDFCCGGQQTLDAACRAAGVACDAVLQELGALAASPATPTPRYAEWSPAFLVDYIVANHHAYVRRALPVIEGHAQKVAEKHGPRHPELLEIARTFTGVVHEMTQHMMKEEQILFPYIKALASHAGDGCPPGPSPFGTVRNPIRMMEAEHEHAGDAMRRIRELSGGYAPPEDACTTYRAMLHELQEFELDLHQHVHLENNILFPAAVTLEGRE